MAGDAGLVSAEGVGQKHKLRRVLGFWPIFGTTVGLVISGTAMVSVGASAGSAGQSAIFTGLIALIPMMAVALAYSELTSMIPGGGMISDYTAPALGRLFAMLALFWGYLIVVIFDGGTQQVIGGLAVQDLLGVPQYIISGLMLVIVAAINLFGIANFGKSELIMTLGMLVIFFIISILGYAHAGEAWGIATPLAEKQPFFAGGAGAIFAGVGIAVWWFIGFEFTCPLAEETKKPHRSIPLALITGLLVIMLLDGLFIGIIPRYITIENLAGSAIPHQDAVAAMLGEPGRILMTILTLLAAVTSANTELASLPRMLYGMARQGLLPKVFAFVHPRWRTPWMGIFFTGFLQALTMIYISIKGADINVVLTFIMIACTSWMFSYAIAIIDLLILRHKFPDFPRLFKVPFGWVVGVIGLIGLAYVVYTLTAYLLYAIIYMVIVVIYSVVWLKVKRYPMFKRTPLEYMVQEVIDRSEPAVDWNEQVEAWLKKRQWSYDGYRNYVATGEIN